MDSLFDPFDQFDPFDPFDLFNPIWLLISLYHVLILAAGTYADVYRYGLNRWEYLSRYFPNPGRADVLVHAVSCGEAMAMRPLVNQNTVLTVHTPTGYRLMRNQGYRCCLKPYDTLFGMLLLFYRVRPRLIIIAESDLWPIFILLAKICRVKIHLLNYRLKGPIRNWIHRGLADRIYVREPTPDPRYTYLGNLKLLDRCNPVVKASPAERLLIVIASAGRDEVAIHLAYIKNILPVIPGAKVIYVPRHLTWEAELRAELNQAGLGFTWTTRAEDALAAPPGLVVCWAFGQLNPLYRWTHICVMGDTFNLVGGHNIVEPALTGNFILLGPHWNTCADLVALLPASGYRVCGSVSALVQWTLSPGIDRIDRIDGGANAHALATYREAVERRVDTYLNEIRTGFTTSLK